MSGHMNLTRRSLISTLSTGAVFADLGAGVRVSLAADPTVAKDILVVMFMRGGQDGLQMMAPAGDENYIRARPNIRVMSSGPQAGIGLATHGGVDMYLHPNLPEVKKLYDTGKLAIVQAVGIPTIDRSHFVCQDLMERGMADREVNQSQGWLARHIPSLGQRSALSTVATGTNRPAALLGDSTAVAIIDPVYFNINGGDDRIPGLIRSVNSGSGVYQASVRTMVDSVAAVQSGIRARRPTSGPEVDYGFSEFGEALRSLATLIKMDIGLDTATVDMSSWDHHAGLANAFGFNATDFSRALAGFWKDLEAFQGRLTIITMTEFGRRFTENSNRGLDHGAASLMMLLGGSVNGGKIYGDWPGLSVGQLDNDSLRATTDCRAISRPMPRLAPVISAVSAVAGRL